MRLHRCAPPAGPLEAAPVTALRPEGEGEWAGFWSAEGAYYALRIDAEGGEEWYQVMADEEEVLRAVARMTPRISRAVAELGSPPRRPPARTLALLGRVATTRAAGITLLWSSRRRRG